jgi:phosphoglycolate phosphatase-like HAD superfamily hydrolase
MAGRSESEIFFDALALNGADVSASGTAESLLEPFSAALAASLTARREDLVSQGQLLPGASAALAAVAALDGVVQTVLTGSSKPGAMLKLRAFDLDRFVDFDIGGYGSEAYPKGTLLRVARQRAADKYGVTFDEQATVYVADSPRDVDAAKIGGARSLAVASGRASAAELREAGADAVLPDLTDTLGLVVLITRLTGDPSSVLAAMTIKLTNDLDGAGPDPRNNRYILIGTTTGLEGRCQACRDGTMLRAWTQATVT